jgi:hypothetical protein
MMGSPIDMRAEEGDETVDELADEAAKTKKQLRDRSSALPEARLPRKYICPNRVRRVPISTSG